MKEQFVSVSFLFYDKANILQVKSAREKHTSAILASVWWCAVGKMKSNSFEPMQSFIVYVKDAPFNFSLTQWQNPTKREVKVA